LKGLHRRGVSRRRKTRFYSIAISARKPARSRERYAAHQRGAAGRVERVHDQRARVAVEKLPRGSFGVRDDIVDITRP